MKAATIEAVIDELNVYIQTCYENQNPMGYFASLYCRVTIAVKEAIDAGRFEDNERMERLDVNFANYFLEALQEPNPTWARVFEHARLHHDTIMQHLLVGMNVHINFDLSQAAVETMPENIQALHHDYLVINQILSEQIDTIQDIMAKSWWLFYILDKVLWRFDEAIVGFEMVKARDFAWENALRLAASEAPEKILAEMDATCHTLHENIVHPPLLLRPLVWLNKQAQGPSVAKLIALIRP